MAKGMRMELRTNNRGGRNIRLSGCRAKINIILKFPQIPSSTSLSKRLGN